MKCPKCHRPLVDEDDGPYICCADAPMQWQCDSCGKVSEGFAFPYGRCPQCGGELALRAPQEAHPDAASLTAVRMAFEIELGGRAFYQRAAADSHDETLRTLFGRFAVMEGEHMETLSRRYHIEAPDGPENSDRAAAIFGEVESRPQVRRTSFDRDRAREAAAEFFVVRGQGSAGSPRRCSQELAAEERDHASILTTSTPLEGRQARHLQRDPLVDAAHAARQPGAALVALNAAAVLLDGTNPPHRACLR
jgi:rubrerythrin